MQDFATHLGFLVAFVIACALDIGTRHDPVVGLVVAGIGAVLIVAFVLVLRTGIRADEHTTRFGDPPSSSGHI